jgi:hypothetical protein
LKVGRHFGGAYSFHPQDRKISQVRIQHEAGIKQSNPLTEVLDLYKKKKGTAPPKRRLAFN